MHRARLTARLSQTIGDGADLFYIKYVVNLELSKYDFRFELAQTV
jgi:hypothetical protein